MINSNITLTLNVALENKLAAFIAQLATSPQKVAEYQNDPESAMAEAGLSEDEKAVLRSGDWGAICEFLGGEVTRPLLVREGGGGEGGD